MTLSMKLTVESYKKLHNQSQQTYYSKTQTNFFKVYARQIQFINRLNVLMSSIEKRKISKVTEEVKVCNKAFRKYLNERRIVHIKIEDAIAFEEMYQKMSLSNMNSSSSNLQDLKKGLLPSVQSNKKQSRLQSLNLSSKLFQNQSKPQNMSLQEREMVKKGFMTLLQKLQTLKKDEFTNQTKYLESVMTRECNKLKEYGFDEDSADILKQQKDRVYNSKMSIVEEIQKEQKINGLYPIIMKNIREETLAIEKAEKNYQILMKS